MQFWNCGDITYFNIPPRGVTRILSADSAAFGANIVFRSGAPRSMKMGTNRSPFPYDAAARYASQSAKLPTPYDFALRLTGAAFDFAGGPLAL
jgi:hypothetical protein